jgi:hypothetical protein
MPIANYQQIKTIFDRPVMVNMKNLFSPSNLVRQQGQWYHLADNKASGTTSGEMIVADMRT